MEFHFVKLNGAYLSMVDPKLKPRIVCFSEKATAATFVNYAAYFRARNRIWPCLDMSRDTRKLEMGLDVVSPYGTPNQIKRFLDIETFDQDSLDKISAKSNVSYFCVVNFDVTYNNGNETETMNISGQEMDGDANPEDFGEWMDLSLKTK